MNSVNVKIALVVDLDGTLLKSDMLHESFWSAIVRNWRSIFLSFVALGRGKAALKNYLSSEADIDITSLPYDKCVIDYIQKYRQQGGRTVLVTASNQYLAEKIAEHLQIFDEVYGSNIANNFQGPAKATFLVDRFGVGEFCYMGDAFVDLSVWQVSSKIVTVNAPYSLRQKAETLGKPIEHLATTSKSVVPYINALRPHQWLKNVLIFIPMLLAHQLNVQTLLSSVIALFAFCLVASSGYVLNDLTDLDADRTHPRKRLRPFASGMVPIAHGGAMIVALLIGGILIGASLGGEFLLLLSTYYVLTTVYSFNLKSRIAIDICTLAGLYTMRIIAGAVATGIDLSFWIVAFSTFFFLSLAAIKRQGELIDIVKRGAVTAKGRGYHADDLPVISIIGLGAGYVSVLVIALYVNSPEINYLYALPQMLWGISCILIYWLTRLVLITNRGSMHDDPLVFALTDRVSQICFIIILSLASIAVLA